MKTLIPLVILMLGVVGCGRVVEGAPIDDGYNKVICDKIVSLYSTDELTPVEIIVLGRQIESDLNVTRRETGPIIYNAAKDQCPSYWQPFWEQVEPFLK